MELLSTAITLAGPLSRAVTSLLGSSSEAQRAATANALDLIAQEARAIARALSRDIGANVNEKSAALETRAKRLPEIFGKFAPKDDVSAISSKIAEVTGRLSTSYDLSAAKRQKARRGIIKELELIVGRFDTEANMLREASQQSPNLLTPAFIKARGAAASGWAILNALASAPLTELANTETFETVRVVAKALRFVGQPKAVDDDAADPPA